MTNSGGNSKLVSALAEELVKELKSQDAFNLSNNEDFKFFTDLLYEALDKKTDAEDKLGGDMQTANDKLVDTANTLQSIEDKLDEVQANSNDNAELLSMKDDDIMSELKTLESDVKQQSQQANEKQKAEGKQVAIPLQDLKQLQAVNNSIKDDVGDINDRSVVILDHINKNYKKQNRQIRLAEKKNEREIKWSRRRMNRKHKLQIGHATNSIKRTIKARFSKWWSRIKKLLLLASLFVFGPVIKNLVGSIVDKTEPMWRPVIDWFEKNFPELVDMIREIASAVETIMDFLKPIVDYFNGEGESEMTSEQAVQEATEQGSVVTATGGVEDVKVLSNDMAENIAQAEAPTAAPIEAEPESMGQKVLDMAAKVGRAIIGGPLAIAEIMGEDDLKRAGLTNDKIFEYYDEQEAKLNALKESTTDPVELQHINANLKAIELNRKRIEAKTMENRGNFATRLGKRRRMNRELEQAEKEYNTAQSLYTDMRDNPDKYPMAGLGTSSVPTEDSEAAPVINSTENTSIKIENKHYHGESKRRNK